MKKVNLLQITKALDALEIKKNENIYVSGNFVNLGINLNKILSKNYNKLNSSIKIEKYLKKNHD